MTLRANSNITVLYIFGMEKTHEKTIKRRSQQIDMLHGPLLKKLLTFALPLAASGLLQMLFNSADVAVIGWFETSAAQAAVNSNGPLINLLINLFAGLSVGVTVVIAGYIGRSDTDDVHSVVLTAAVVAGVSGVVLLALGMLVAEPLLTLMDTPPEVLALAAQYLRIYFAGMPFIMVYNFGAAILRSVGDTRRPLYVLIGAGVLNVGLNLLFVALFKMSVAGVATATLISDAVSAAFVVAFVMRDKMLRIRRGSEIRGKYLKKIFAIGIPAGLQGMVFSLSNVIIQATINGFGEKAMAGSGDAIYFENYMYFFVSAFSQTAVTFMGQNYAAGEFERCKRIFWLNMAASLIISGVLSVVFVAGGRAFIRIYTSDEQAIEYALLRMRTVLIAGMLTCTYEIAGGALRGIGNSLLPAIITVVGSCVFRIVWIYAVLPHVGGTYTMLVIVYPISWAITGAVMLVTYFAIAAKKLKRPPAPPPDLAENLSETPPLPDGDIVEQTQAEQASAGACAQAGDDLA